MHKYPLLDEPTNSLDLECKDKLIKFIERSKKTMLIISHDKEIILACTEVIEIKDKQIFKRKDKY